MKFHNASLPFEYALCLAFFATTACAQSQSLPPATVGQAYATHLAIHVNGVVPFRFKVGTGDLPAGLMLSAAEPEITGTPLPGSAGNHQFVIVGTDAESHTASEAFQIEVSENVSPSDPQATDSGESKQTNNGAPQPCQPITITSGLRAGSTSLQGHATSSKGSNDISIQMDIIYGAKTASDALSLFLQAAGFIDARSAARQNLTLSKTPATIFRKTVAFRNPSSSRVASDGTFNLELVDALDTGEAIVLTQVGCTLSSYAQDQTNLSGSTSDIQNEPMSNLVGVNAIARPQAQKPSAVSSPNSAATRNTAQTGTANPLNLAAGKTSPQSSQAYVVPGTIDWGRVKALFLIGAVFSNQDQQFSQSNIFASFSLDKAWALPCYFGYAPTAQGYQKYPPPKDADYPDGTTCSYRSGFSTFFETRLTSIPVSSNAATDSKTTPTTAASSTSTSSPSSAPSLQSLLTNKKTARFDLGGYAPFLITRWVHDSGPQALFIGPLAKAGFDTLVDSTTVNSPQSSSTTASSTLAVPRLYNFFGGGARIGHYHLHNDRNESPDPISHLDVVFGKFSNFESLVSNCHVGVPSPCRTRLWRTSFEGLLQIPTPDNFPLYVGFNANVGQKLIGAGNVVNGGDAGDDLRFFFGTQLDLGSLVTKLKGTSGSSSAPSQ